MNEGRIPLVISRTNSIPEPIFTLMCASELFVQQEYNGRAFVTGTIGGREGFQWGFRQTTAERTSIIEERNESACPQGRDGKHKSDTKYKSNFLIKKKKTK